jgi:hypothetical protein
LRPAKEEEKMLEPTILEVIKHVAETKKPVEIATGGWSMLERWNWIRRALMLEERKEFIFEDYVEDQFILDSLINKVYSNVFYVTDECGNTWLMTEYEALRRSLLDAK